MAIDKSVYWTDRFYKKSSSGWKCNVCFHESVVIGDIRRHIQIDHYDYYDKLYSSLMNNEDETNRNSKIKK